MLAVGTFSRLVSVAIAACLFAGLVGPAFSQEAPPVGTVDDKDLLERRRQQRATG